MGKWRDLIRYNIDVIQKVGVTLECVFVLLKLMTGNHVLQIASLII